MRYSSLFRRSSRLLGFWVSQVAGKDGISSIVGKLPGLQPCGPAEPRGALARLPQSAPGNLGRFENELHVKVKFLTAQKASELD